MLLRVTILLVAAAVAAPAFAQPRDVREPPFGEFDYSWINGSNNQPASLLTVGLGIFPSYIGLESYLPQENWNYTHAFVSDATPYYFVGLRTQLYLTRRLKLELWLVNGWQTFGQWHEARAGGYSFNWRPREWISLVHSLYL